MTPNLIKHFEYISKQVPGLEFHLNVKWASTYTDHRLNIRRHLYKKTKNKIVLDLKHIPKALNIKNESDQVYVCISHCPVLGGFLLSEKPIGFDLEQKQRLSPGLLQRISDAKERQILPHQIQPALWTIKESVYKLSDTANSNMVGVTICASEVVQDFILKTESDFNGKIYITWTLLADPEDLCLSVSIEKP